MVCLGVNSLTQYFTFGIVSYLFNGVSKFEVKGEEGIICYRLMIDSAVYLHGVKWMTAIGCDRS